MDSVNVMLNNGTVFDDVVHNSLKDGGDLAVVTKDHGTLAGRPIVCLTFTVQLPDGKLARAQTVVTGRLFSQMAAAFRGRYGPEGDMVCTASVSN